MPRAGPAAPFGRRDRRGSRTETWQPRTGIFARERIEIIAAAGRIAARLIMPWAVVAVLLFALQPATARTEAPAAPADVERVRAAAAEELNRFRGENGRAPLVENELLARAAENYARYVAATGIYEHDADGRQPAERAAEQGYEACVLLENLAFAESPGGFTAEDLAQRFVRGWIASPGHRENLLNGDVSEAGLAAARSVRNGAYYGVHLLARPRRHEMAFRVANGTGRAIRYRLSPAGRQALFELQPRESNEHVRCAAGRLQVEGARDEEAIANDTEYRVREQDGRLVVDARERRGGAAGQ